MPPDLIMDIILCSRPLSIDAMMRDPAWGNPGACAAPGPTAEALPHMH